MDRQTFSQKEMIRRTTKTTIKKSTLVPENHSEFIKNSKWGGKFVVLNTRGRNLDFNFISYPIRLKHSKTQEFQTSIIRAEHNKVISRLKSLNKNSSKQNFKAEKLMKIASKISL